METCSPAHVQRHPNSPNACGTPSGLQKLERILRPYYSVSQKCPWCLRHAAGRHRDSALSPREASLANPIPVCSPMSHLELSQGLAPLCRLGSGATALGTLVSPAHMMLTGVHSRPVPAPSRGLLELQTHWADWGAR